MRVRSWMAALALIAGTSIAVGRAMPAQSSTRESGSAQNAQVDSSSASSQPQTAKSKPADRAIKSIFLNLEIAGLGRGGCDVEITPGNPACKFGVINLKREQGKLVPGKPGAQHVSSEGHAVVELQNVELRNADHTCMVKITVRESGQTPKVVYRGFRIPAQNPSASPEGSGHSLSFTCLMSASSKVANIDQARARK